MIEGWQAQAFNQEPNSPNEIHGDDMARAYGFSGGLVPGVTVSAYLLQPAVVAWSERFLTQGRTHAKVLSPLYDNEQFSVTITEQAGDSYRATLARPDGTVSAQAEADLLEAPPPVRRGDALMPDGFEAPAATPDNLQRLMVQGCLACRFRWQPDHTMGTYLRDRQSMPALLVGQDAHANMAFLLGISNWTAALNFYMNPWVHLETWSQNYRAVPAGTDIVAEMQLTDLFEKRGHQFFDADFNLFDAADNAALASIRLRAIYRLRPAGETR